MQRVPRLPLKVLLSSVALVFLFLETGSAHSQPHVSNLKGGDVGGTPLAFLPDGKTLAGIRYSRQAHPNDPTQITLWDLQTGQIKRTLKIPFNSESSLAFSPDGKTLATGSGDQFTGQVQLWDLQSGKLKRTLARTIFETGPVGGIGPVWGLAYSADGRTLWAGVVREGENSIASEAVLLGSRTGRILRTVELPNDAFGHMVFSPRQHTVAVIFLGKSIHLSSLSTGKTIRTLQNASNPKIGRIKAVCFSPDGKHLISFTKDQRIEFWNIKTGKVVNTLTNKGEPYSPLWPSLAISKKGDVLAMGGTAGIRLVPIKSMQR